MFHAQVIDFNLFNAFGHFLAKFVMQPFLRDLCIRRALHAQTYPQFVWIRKNRLDIRNLRPIHRAQPSYRLQAAASASPVLGSIRNACSTPATYTPALLPDWPHGPLPIIRLVVRNRHVGSRLA
jgi:hypothetical protein